MSTKHNISIIALTLGGLALVLFFGWATIKEGRKNNSGNPYEGITRPQLYSESPTEGDENAKTILYEFGDYNCTHCQEMQSVVEQIFVKYGDRLKHVWKDFPLISEESKKAAVAARCAKDQGKFWQYHGWLFKNQKDIGKISYQAGALSNGIDAEKFTTCLAEEKQIKLVDRDFLEGQALGIDVVPFFVIGDRAFFGIVSFEDFENVVLQEIGKL